MTTHTTPLAERLAAYAAGLTFEQLDSVTVHEVKRRLIDTLGCAVGAWNSPPALFARRLAARVAGTPGAQALGVPTRTSPELAAFVNGILFRYLDFNDTYLSLEPAHPSDNFAATLAAADAAECTGREFVIATAIAYELQCRLCDAASIRARGWDHVTYGAVSTAAAAARLFGLDAQGIAQAINLSVTPNVALRQTRSGELSHWKGCAFANASRNGVFAALLAAEGMSGPSPVFEGEFGFFRLVSGPLALPRLGGEAGADFMIQQTSIKYWPAEYHSQSAIEAALAIGPRIPDPSAIESLRIETFDAAADIIVKDPEKWRPKTRETADHSLPYCVAAALCTGDVTLASFDESHLNDPRILAVIGRTTVERNSEFTAKYPHAIPNRITVTLTSGETLVEESEHPPGHARNPLTDADVEEKFLTLTRGLLPPTAQQQLLDACYRLDELPGLDPLWSALSAVGM